MAKVKKNLPPKYEDFVRELSAIYMDGDPIEAWERVSWYIENEQTRTGEPVTWKLILQKYREHIALWNFRFAEKERTEGGRYFTEKMRQERKNIYDFMGSRMYEWEFIIPRGRPERDKYLFGEVSQTSLSNSHKRFKERLKIIDHGESETTG